MGFLESRFGPTLPFQPSAAFRTWQDAHGRFAVNASVVVPLTAAPGAFELDQAQLVIEELVRVDSRPAPWTPGLGAKPTA